MAQLYSTSARENAYFHHSYLSVCGAVAAACLSLSKVENVLSLTHQGFFAFLSIFVLCSLSQEIMGFSVGYHFTILPSPLLISSAGSLLHLTTINSGTTITPKVLPQTFHGNSVLCCRL